MRIGIDASLASLRGSGTGRYAALLVRSLLDVDQENEYVLLHDPDEIAVAMGQLLGDEALRGRLAGHGLERARSFSWDRTARQVRGVYESAGAG